jgi:CysZ protein
VSSNIESINESVYGFFIDGKPGEINYWFLTFIKIVSYTFILYYVYQPLSLILLAPLFSLLSENVQDCINNKNTEFNLSRFWGDVKRGVIIGVKNVLIQVPILIILFFMSLIFPPISPFTIIASFLVTSYFYGFTMMDYRNEYYRLNPQESRSYVNSNLFQSITIGAIFNFLLYIPILGTIFGPAFALVSAALSSDNKVDK